MAVVTKEHAERLARLLESTGLAQPRKSMHAENRVNVLCRVMPGNEDKWVDLIRKLLVAELEESSQIYGWQCHVCRHYFIKQGEDGSKQLVWGWNISIQSTEMPLSLDIITKLLRGEPLHVGGETRELNEFPIYGMTNNRNKPNAGGKGVHGVGDSDFHPAKKR
jgi:hypothetical protein